MSLVVRRYLVDRETAEPVVSACCRLEREFMDCVKAMGDPLLGIRNLADENQALIDSLIAREEDIFRSFVRDHGLASALDARDGATPEFDNFFKWSISCKVAGTRLLMEVRAANAALLPFDGRPWLREIDEEVFSLLSGEQRS